MSASITQLPNNNNLPVVEAANLPPLYENAKNAIAECARIDECKG